MVETANDKRIPLKTDEKYWQKKDFIQTEIGTVKELLVTVTLSEYRELVSMEQYYRDQVNELTHENTELKRKIATRF